MKHRIRAHVQVVFDVEHPAHVSQEYIREVATGTLREQYEGLGQVEIHRLEVRPRTEWAETPKAARRTAC